MYKQFIAIIGYLPFLLLTFQAHSQDQFILDSIKESMVLVDGGDFTMGCTPEQGTDCIRDEIPSHRVSIRSFYISILEVNQIQYHEIMGKNPSLEPHKDGSPVNKISWNDAMAFIQKLNSISGFHYRLPTEAEWEFAARGGIKSGGFKYSGSSGGSGDKDLSRFMWVDFNTRKPNDLTGLSEGVRAELHKPNELGIYNMSGNVWEWCSDWYNGDYYTVSPKNNPSGPQSGVFKVVRGCSYGSADLSDCRVSRRSRVGPDNATFSGVGFRLARDL